jgi:enoyl-CoA hydratase/carnithine racemase
MIFTGRNIGAEEALQWGLVDRVVEDPVKEAIEIAKTIASKSPDAVWASRRAYLWAWERGMRMRRGGSGRRDTGRV